MICYSIPWSSHVLIVEYSGVYCHLSKVNMSQWHHKDILRRTNFIYFCNRWFKKKNQYEFLKMNLFQLINSMKIRVLGVFLSFCRTFKKSLCRYTILGWLLWAFYVNIFLQNSFKCCVNFWKSNIFFQNLKLYIYKTVFILYV